MARKSKFQRVVKLGEIFKKADGTPLDGGDIMLDIPTEPDRNKPVVCRGCPEILEVITPGWTKDMPFSRHCPRNHGPLRFVTQQRVTTVPATITRHNGKTHVSFTLPQ